MLILLGLLSACGRNLTEIEELHAIIETLRHENMFLRSDLERAEHLNWELHFVIDDLTAEPLRFDESHQLMKDTARSVVVNSLIENSIGLAAEINSRLGYPAGDEFIRSLLTYGEYVYVSDSYAVVSHSIALPVMLTYNADFEWTLLAYIDVWYCFTALHPIPEPGQSRNLTDVESVTLRFYDWFNAPMWDLFGVTVTGDYSAYQSITIPGEQLWDEAIRLTEFHYRIPVRDIWYEGDILYVDILPATARFSVGLGSVFHGLAVRDTFMGFPGVSDVRILMSGRRFPPGYNGFDINCLPGCPLWGTWGMGLSYACICIW